MPKYWRGCWLALAAFGLDRATKWWAESALRDGPSVAVWPGVLNLTYVENTGAAFGLFQGRQAALAVVTGIVLLAMLIGLLWQGGRLPTGPRLAGWLLFGGALGNFVDRVARGAVIDFLEFRLFQFPVFNVADICVSVAFVLLAAWVIFGGEWKTNGG